MKFGPPPFRNVAARRVALSIPFMLGVAAFWESDRVTVVDDAGTPRASVLANQVEAGKDWIVRAGQTSGGVYLASDPDFAGQPSVRKDAIARGTYDNATARSNWQNWGVLAGEFTTISVFKTAAVQGFVGGLCPTGVGGGASSVLFIDSAGAGSAYVGSSGYTPVSIAGTAARNLVTGAYVRHVVGAVTTQVRWNMGTQAAISSYALPSQNIATIGNARGATYDIPATGCKVAAQYFFARALSAADLTQMGTYINGKYGTPTAGW